MVLSPGAIERFAHTYITSLYVAPEQRRLTVDLVRQFPSVSVFDIGAVLDQVRRSMDRAALAVQYVFLFTLAAIGAATIGYLIATRLFQLQFVPGIALPVGGLVAGALIVGISGTLAVRSVINHSPVATLRGA